MVLLIPKRLQNTKWVMKESWKIEIWVSMDTISEKLKIWTIFLMNMVKEWHRTILVCKSRILVQSRRSIHNIKHKARRCTKHKRRIFLQLQKPNIEKEGRHHSCQRAWPNQKAIPLSWSAMRIRAALAWARTVLLSVMLGWGSQENHL